MAAQASRLHSLGLLFASVAALSACGGASEDAGSAADATTSAAADREKAQAVETWTRVASEWQSFSVSGTKTVRYGTGTSWRQRSVTGNGQCTTSFFGGDPARGKSKVCEVLSVTDDTPTPPPPPPPTSGGDATWSRIAGEWQNFSVSGSQTVRFGAGSAWRQRTVSGSGQCTSSFFGGDPAPGVSKACERLAGGTSTPPPPPAGPADDTWTRIASEWQSFSVSGTRQVRYGATGKWLTRTLSGSGQCTSSFFGSDPAPGVNKWCEAAGDDVAGNPPPPPPSDGGGTGFGSMPTPASIAGKRVVGRIDVYESNTVIENVHVVNPTGMCIVVHQGVTNVTIRNNEIGPCGANVPGSTDSTGVLILPNANRITVEKNVIHDVSTGVHAYQARHPIVVDRNFVYNVRGPFPAGQMVTFHTVTSGSGRSKITCNMSDAWYGSGRKSYEDHISLFASAGTSADPIEIAYNRIRGGTSQTGSGMNLADHGGANLWAHDNVVVHAANAGIAVSGGTNIRVENNKVDNRGANRDSLTHQAYAVRRYNACSNITLRGNRGIARLWAWNHDGETVPGYGTDGGCPVNLVDNIFGDTSLSADMFNQTPSACN